MRIDLRGGDVFVAEQFLNAADVGTMPEQVSGKAVSEGMGCVNSGAIVGQWSGGAVPAAPE